MDNRIRLLRKERGLTLAGLAARCRPRTTAQTIGRLETGMRTLSLDWLDRIAEALDVPPAQLIPSGPLTEEAAATALLTTGGIEALDAPQQLSLPRWDVNIRLVRVTDQIGEYREGDILWFETLLPERLEGAINRDILLPGRAGGFHFGRLVALKEGRATVLPPLAGAAPEHVEGFAWAARLRKLIRNLD